MFKEVNVRDINENLIKMIADEWMLIAAGDQNRFNMMTASWGSIGEMWGLDVATCVIRPQRFTREFVENNDYFSLSFYGADAKKNIHGICGSKSGRDVDKVKETGLTAVFNKNTVYFEEARIVLILKKIYTYDIDPSKFLGDMDRWYPDKDYHKAYVGEITGVLVKE